MASRDPALRIFGRLLLVPTPLYSIRSATRKITTPPAEPWLCEAERRRVEAVTRFYVETPKTARIWLRQLGLVTPLQQLDVRALPRSDLRIGSSSIESSFDGSPDRGTDWAPWLAPIFAGQDVGLMSDAGCPGIADPGAELVAAAHAAEIEVVPLIGPSSVLLGLMASGLDGQRFAFHGYLPVARDARIEAIAELARRSSERHETQILIETPYRNQAMTTSLIETLPGSARLCIAIDLGGANQSITSRRIERWRQRPPYSDARLPAIFLFLA